MKKTQFKGVAMLLVTAFIWGTAFVAQSVGMDSVGAFTFNCVRTFLGAAVLLPFVALKNAAARRKTAPEEAAAMREKTVLAVKRGVLLGVVFFVASTLQQFAFYWSSAGKIAFITALYMFFVPLFGLFIGKRVHPLMWLCVAAGFIGTFLLTADPSDLGNVNIGDLLTLCCAVAYAVHILTVERFAPDVDGVLLAAVQFAVGAFISLPFMLIFERPSLENVTAAAIPILYAGFMSCGVAYTFQIIGQKYTDATVASLLMCCESVFAVVASAIILGERMTVTEIVGCAVMFAAIVGSQFVSALPAPRRSRP